MNKKKRFCDRLIYNLIYAFERVRKVGIQNELSLKEEFAEYLYPDELVYVSKLLKRAPRLTTK